MALFGPSIDATRTLGAGLALEPDQFYAASRVTLFVNVQDADGTLQFVVDLEATLDGINWRKEFSFGYPTDIGRAGNTNPFSMTGGNAFRAYRAFRANLVSFSDGPGGIATVSAAIAILPT